MAGPQKSSGSPEYAMGLNLASGHLTESGTQQGPWKYQGSEWTRDASLWFRLVPRVGIQGAQEQGA